jgi:peroxiredoxin
MPSYEEQISEFEGLDTQVLGVSTDNVPSNDAWAKSLGGLSYPLLSDFNPQGQVALKYGVLREGGITERAIFIINKDGIIQYIDIHDINQQPENDVLFDILKTIEAPVA